jgi:hypothetical protein
VTEAPQRMVQRDRAAGGRRRELRGGRGRQDDRGEEREQEATQGFRPDEKTPETNASAR